MKKFVVAYASLFENKMEIDFIEAETLAKAVEIKLERKEWDLDSTNKPDLTYDEICEIAFDGDIIVGAKELP